LYRSKAEYGLDEATLTSAAVPGSGFVSRRHFLSAKTVRGK
jgi:hypothetical protein